MHFRSSKVYGATAQFARFSIPVFLIVKWWINTNSKCLCTGTYSASWDFFLHFVHKLWRPIYLYFLTNICVVCYSRYSSQSTLVARIDSNLKFLLFIPFEECKPTLQRRALWLTKISFDKVKERLEYPIPDHFSCPGNWDSNSV